MILVLSLELHILRAGPGPGAVPAHPLGQQDPADQAAADFEAQPLCFSGQCVESPLRWSGPIRRSQLAVGLHREPARRGPSDQGDDLGAFRLGDPTLAA